MVNVRVGGHFLYERAAWEMLGPGVTASPEITRIERIWFEGPLIKQPASQQKEDYPQDYAAQVQIAADAPPVTRYWRTWNAQGATPVMKFVVGHLPEVVEQETDGQPIPMKVGLPVTINGRVFPREDVDVWSFDAAAGQTITCSVAAAEIGSPLEGVIEVRDPNDRVVAESSGELRLDPQLRFTAAESGAYQVRIWDSRFGGLQHYVYRLTVSADAWIDHIFPLGGRRGQETEVEVAGQGIPNCRIKIRWPAVEKGIVRHTFDLAGALLNPVLCDVDELPEVLEGTSDDLPTVTVPGVANGRIEQPRDADAWPFEAKKGIPLRIEVRAARLGSPLDGVLVVKDNSGKELARADDLPGGVSDCELDFSPPADGKYIAEVRERFASRGGAAFAYRLRITPSSPDFQITLPVDTLAASIGGEQKLAINLQRSGGLPVPVRLSVERLPPGVTCAEVEVAANQNKGELVIKVGKESPVQVARLKVVGKAEWNGQTLQRDAVFPHGDDPAMNHVLLACALPTPFRFKADYEFRYIARGGTLKKHYRIERGGYEGPLEVSLADRQGRHLQGVTGPTITVPPGASEFDYTVYLPPWMELGRTSRTNLMMVGELADASGKKHKVSFSTVDQNEQLIALVSPAPLRLSLERSAVAARPASELVVPVQLHRQTGLDAACRLELIVPPHMRDIAAETVNLDAKSTAADLKIRLGEQPGPLNMPLLIRATITHDGAPIVAETNLELIAK